MIQIYPISFGSPAFDEVLALRDRILRKPLGLVFEVKDIQKEYDQIHLAGYIDGVLFGTLTLVEIDEFTLKMRQVAIDTPFQGKGLGTGLVQASEEWANQYKYRKIVLNARDTAVPFYKKLHYRKEGKPFREVGIKHYAMSKKW